MNLPLAVIKNNMNNKLINSLTVFLILYLIIITLVVQTVMNLVLPHKHRVDLLNKLLIKGQKINR